MTKLVKNLIIGGTGTTVIAGAGAGVGVSLSQKKAANRNEQPVVAKAAQPTVTVEGTFALPSFSGIREVAPIKIENKEVFSGTAYAVPTMMTPAIHVPTPTPSLIPNMVPNIAPQAIPQMVPNAIPSQIPPQIGQVPHQVVRPTVPAGGFVFGGRSQVVVPPLKGTYQTHEGIHHLALDSDMQLIPGLPQAQPQAVPYEVPKLIVTPTVPTHGLVFGGHAQEIVPPLKETTQTHEATNGAAVVWSNDPQATPYLHVNLEAKAALPSFSGIRENAPVKIENPEVFSGTGYAIPSLIPQMTPNMVPGATPTPLEVVAPRQVALVNNFAPISPEGVPAHYQVPTQKVVTPTTQPQAIQAYATPWLVYAAQNLKSGFAPIPMPTPSVIVSNPRIIIVPKLVSAPDTYLIPEQRQSMSVEKHKTTSNVEYVVPSLKVNQETTDAHPAAIIDEVAPAGKLANAHIVGAVRQPYFETFVATPVVSSSVDLATESSFGATYHAIEGINHAAYFNGVLQQTPPLAPSATPNLAPSAVPYLVPKLGPVVAPVAAPQDSHVHSIYAEHDLDALTPIDGHVHIISDAHDYYPTEGHVHPSFGANTQPTLYDVMKALFTRAAESTTPLAHDYIHTCLNRFNFQEIRDAANNVFGDLRTIGDRDSRMFGLHDRLLTHHFGRQ